MKEIEVIDNLVKTQLAKPKGISPLRSSFVSEFRTKWKHHNVTDSCSCYQSCGSNFSRNGECSCYTACGSNYSM